jgi:GxxExxY protein
MRAWVGGLGRQLVASEPIPERTEGVARIVIDCCYTVHKALGPGLLENVYELCMCHELSKRGLAFQRQVECPVVYDGIRMESGFRLDLLVENEVVVELKAVEATLPVHVAQLLTYLKLSERRLGFLVNFNVPLIKEGIKRLAR